MPDWQEAEGIWICVQKCVQSCFSHHRDICFGHIKSQSKHKSSNYIYCSQEIAGTPLYSCMLTWQTTHSCLERAKMFLFPSSLSSQFPFQWFIGQWGNSEYHSVSLQCGLAKGLKTEVRSDGNIYYRFPLLHKSSHFLQLEINPSNSTEASATTVGLSRKSLLLRGASEGEEVVLLHKKKYCHSNFPLIVRLSVTP